MRDEPTHYLCCRSHGDHRLFVVCYADRFYEDVPADVRSRGPWRGERGEIVRLKSVLRMALADVLLASALALGGFIWYAQTMAP